MNKIDFYRVGHKDTQQGLWYDQEGNFTGLIHDKLSFCKNTKLEMPFDKSIQGWLSATKTIDDLFLWFTKEDIIELQKYGWNIQHYKTDSFKSYDYLHKGLSLTHWVIDKNKSELVKQIRI